MAVGRGDFDGLYERFAPMARDEAHRVLHDHAAAEDIAHDVLLNLWARPQQFDSARGTMATFVRMTARCRALDAWRRRDVRTRAVERFGSHQRPAVDRDAAAIVASRDSTISLLAAMAQLPPNQRQAVLLMYGQGLTAAEIAAALGTPLGTVKSRVRLGCDKLRGTLGEAHPNAGAEAATWQQ